MRLLTIIIALLFCASVSQAQVDSVYYGTEHPSQKEAKKKEPKNNAWKEKITWGGNLQLWIGNPTFILLTPTIGYIPFKKFNKFNVGIGGVYNYTSFNSPYGNYAQSIYGGHSYARYTIGENYFVQVQYDKLLQPDLFSTEPNDKVWIDYIFLGGGFCQPISDKVGLSTSIMYNVNQNRLSIYPSRLIIQFGIIGTF